MTKMDDMIRKVEQIKFQEIPESTGDTTFVCKNCGKKIMNGWFHQCEMSPDVRPLTPGYNQHG